MKLLNYGFLNFFLVLPAFSVIGEETLDAVLGATVQWNQEKRIAINETLQTTA